MKRIAVLGSTGSIGQSTLDVVARFPDRFSVVALAAGGGRPERMARQVRETGARLVGVAEEGQARELRRLLPAHVDICVGTEGLVQVATAEDAELVVSAIVGAAGLAPTYAAVVAGKDVALANKESLVVAGELVLKAARESGSRLLPVDSEHSAVFQVLDGKDTEQVRRLILTASGGPFRGRGREALSEVTVDQALDHPNWSMGPKITVDSATLMNKGLEVIEAHWLFGLPSEAIQVTLHPQSVVHSLVEFIDGSMLAQMGVPDMRGPISYALNYPKRLEMPDLGLSLWEMGALTFEPPDLDSFPCLTLAYRALAEGGCAPAVMSGANEVAVEAFLEGRISFLQISETVTAVLDAHPSRSLDTVHSALEADREARRLARQRLTRPARQNRGNG